MKRTYTCPHCQGVLNPGTKIVLRGERGASRALVLLCRMRPLNPFQEYPHLFRRLDVAPGLGRADAFPVASAASRSAPVSARA